MNKVWVYVKSILVPVLIGGIVGFIISGYMDYETLQKPFLAPPNFLFPIVWTVLYILMGVSYGILSSNSLVDDSINSVYYGQLFVNAIWPIAFFVLKWRLFAFFWILLLDVLVGIMVYRFYQKNKAAGLLQLPYLAWCLFASYLNFGVYILNK